MGSLHPNLDQLRAFAGDASAVDTPLLMLNLLRFRDRADYADGFDAEPCSGRQAYERYMAEANGFVAGVGGRMSWKATVIDALIAPDDEAWDLAFVVEYPSRAAFIAMLSDPGYQAIVAHRTAALEDSRLVAMTAG